MKEFNIKKRLMLPLKEKDVLSLHAGDFVLLTGLIVTGRDKLHKFLVKEKPSRKEIPFDLQGSVLYHCGPAVRKKANNYEIIACGPTTSIRVDMYEPEVIFRYGLKGIMGKGGMGEQTLNALSNQDLRHPKAECFCATPAGFQLLVSNTFPPALPNGNRLPTKVR